MRIAVGASLLLVTVGAAAGCAATAAAPSADSTSVSSPVSSPQSATPGVADALSACRAALPGHLVVSGTWTTVGAVHTWVRGGVQHPADMHPLARAFPASDAAEPAAWCWTRDAPATDAAWALVPGHVPVHGITLTCQGCAPGRPVPSGPPGPVP
jgi:hypothetical protein